MVNEMERICKNCVYFGKGERFAPCEISHDRQPYFGLPEISGGRRSAGLSDKLEGTISAFGRHVDRWRGAQTRRSTASRLHRTTSDETAI